MRAEQVHGYYAKRRRRLLRAFDRFARWVAPRLAEQLDAGQVEAVLAAARAEFDRLIPELPYIGGRRNVFTPVMVVNGWLLALHRAMTARGRSARDVIRVCAEVSDDFFRSAPGRLLRLLGRLAFTWPVWALLRWQAERSQERRYPEDFVYRVERTDEGEVALVFDECAVNKFYDAQGTPELKPYCNFFDVTYSRVMGMGIDARETIGLGCARCSLRYKLGRDTVVPETLRGVLPRT
jgi:hypothetical protein